MTHFAAPYLCMGYPPDAPKDRHCFCLKNRKSAQSTWNDVDAPARLRACFLLASSCDSCGFS